MSETDPTTTDPKAEGIDHLQRAAREMVAAARSFLDAIEQVVEDRETLREVSTTVTGLAATVGEALGDAVRGGRPAPWVDAAWAGGDERPTGAAEPATDAQRNAGPDDDAVPDDAVPDEDAGDAAPDEVAGVAVPDDAAGRAPDAAGAADDGDTDGGTEDDTEDWARPLVDPDAPRRPSRVRRIAVD